MKLTRYENNPILSPNEANDWEALVTTNPGAWYDEDEGEVKLLYRAAGKDPEHVIRLGMAVSSDGYGFERASDEPWRVTHRTRDWLLEPVEPYETQGCYGGGDQYVGLATCPLAELLDELLECPADSAA